MSAKQVGSVSALVDGSYSDGNTNTFHLNVDNHTTQRSFVGPQPMQAHLNFENDSILKLRENVLKLSREGKSLPMPSITLYQNIFPKGHMTRSHQQWTFAKDMNLWTVAQQVYKRLYADPEDPLQPSKSSLWEVIHNLWAKGVAGQWKHREGEHYRQSKSFSNVMDDEGQVLHEYQDLSARLQRYGRRINLVSQNRLEAKRLLTAVAEWIDNEYMSDIEPIEPQEIQRILDEATSAFEHLIKRAELLYFWD